MASSSEYNLTSTSGSDTDHFIELDSPTVADKGKRKYTKQQKSGSVFRRAVTNMQKKKLNERTLVDELLENQDVAIDIIIHEEVREEVPSSSKKQKASKQTKKSSERDRAVRETERERLKQLSDARKDNLKRRIDDMAEEKVKKILFSAIERQPGLIFSVIEEEEHPVIQSGQSSVPSWCVCGKCREMVELIEQVCCKRRPEDCISILPEMEYIITEPSTLSLQNSYRDDIYVFGDEEDYNKALRHAAYRQFTLWRYQYLGANNRRVIPSCCVWKIRDKFPSLSQVYTGFRPDRLARYM